MKIGRSRVWMVVAGCVAWAAGLTGCASTGGSAGPAAAYQSGDYQGAYREASLEYAASQPPARDEAALVAGLSAFAMYRQTRDTGRLNDAQNWLSPLAMNSNSEVAGKAGATLGLVAMARDQYSVAASRLSQAAVKLKGEDAAQANYHAGLAYQALGQTSAATRSYQLAQATTTDPALKSELRARLGGGGGGGGLYTVQVGAFESTRNAEQAAATARDRAGKRSLGEVRVVQRRQPSGRTLHIVQVGSFASAQEARKALLALAMEGIVTLAEP